MKLLFRVDAVEPTQGRAAEKDVRLFTVRASAIRPSTPDGDDQPWHATPNGTLCLQWLKDAAGSVFSVGDRLEIEVRRTGDGDPTPVQPAARTARASSSDRKGSPSK